MKYLMNCTLPATVAIVLCVVVGPTNASATTLEVGKVTQSSSVTMKSSLTAKTSTSFVDSSGTPADTCFESEIWATTEAPYSGATIKGLSTKLTLSGCTHVTAVLSAGQLSVTWTSGTNGFAISSGAEWTILVTAFGVTATCKTGSGTTIGTLTGVSSGNATLDINTKISCGILGTSTWAGTYTLTSPTGLGIVS